MAPRGTASIQFGLLLVERSRLDSETELSQIVVLTVLISVLAHGASSHGGAAWYARRLAMAPTGADMRENAPVDEMAVCLPLRE